MRETISSHRGAIGFIYGAVIQRTVDRPDDYAPGYHLILDAGRGLRCGGTNRFVCSR